MEYHLSSKQVPVDFNEVLKPSLSNTERGLLTAPQHLCLFPKVQDAAERVSASFSMRNSNHHSHLHSCCLDYFSITSVKRTKVWLHLLFTRVTNASTVPIAPSLKSLFSQEESWAVIWDKRRHVLLMTYFIILLIRRIKGTILCCLHLMERTEATLAKTLVHVGWMVLPIMVWFGWARTGFGLHADRSSLLG